MDNSGMREKEGPEWGCEGTGTVGQGGGGQGGCRKKGEGGTGSGAV